MVGHLIGVVNVSDEPKIDYEAVLADLEAKKAAIEYAIEGVRVALGLGTVAVLQKPTSSKPIMAADIAPDAFFQMSIGDAVKKYLAMVKGPRGMKEILDALERGGMVHRSKNFYTTVHASLARREEQQGDLVRVKRKWALAEWYPGRKQTRQQGKENE